MTHSLNANTALNTSATKSRPIKKVSPGSVEIEEFKTHLLKIGVPEEKVREVYLPPKSDGLVRILNEEQLSSMQEIIRIQKYEAKLQQALEKNKAKSYIWDSIVSPELKAYMEQIEKSGATWKYQSPKQRAGLNEYRNIGIATTRFEDICYYLGKQNDFQQYIQTLKDMEDHFNQEALRNQRFA